MCGVATGFTREVSQVVGYRVLLVESLALSTRSLPLTGSDVEHTSQIFWII